MIRFYCFVMLSIFSVSGAGARTCSDDRNQSGSCFIQYNGVERGRCEVCREGKSCFMALDGRERELCEAYAGGKSCFMATNNSVDRGWCEHLKEGKSCFMALNGEERERCERGHTPRSHAYWVD
ncbi:hypothetical protein [Bdellovibrio bacteriovorus]|nr:hypothetical protein [Bdellovibrio bacteriovorus]